MFETVPGAGDLYVMSRVIHDWEDARAAAVLRNCRRAMDEQARLILVERVLPDVVEPLPAAQRIMLSDLNMMVRTGGHERTEGGFAALLSQSDLQLVRIVPTGGPVSVIEAAPT